MITDDLRDTLDVLTGTNADVTAINWTKDPAWRTVALADCRSYDRVCKAYRKTPDGGRMVRNGINHRRDHDCDVGPFVAVHHCWPHLTCWSAS